MGLEFRQADAVGAHRGTTVWTHFPSSGVWRILARMQDALSDVGSLTTPEKVALVVLLKHLVTADHQVSRDEAVALSQVVQRVGPEAFRAADSVRLTDEASVTSFLRTVTRQMARDIIYEALLEAAKADDIQAEETSLLDLVADAWDIVVTESHSSE